jgi:hypothetical protein
VGHGTVPSGGSKWFESFQMVLNIIQTHSNLDLIQKGSFWVQKKFKNMVVKYLMRGTTLLIETSPDLKVNLN